MLCKFFSKQKAENIRSILEITRNYKLIIMTIHHNAWHPYLLHHVDLQTFSGWPRSIFPKFMKLISLLGFASCFAFPAQMIWVHPRGPASFVHIILIYHTGGVSLDRVVVVVVAGNYWGISWSILHFISMIAGYARSHNVYFFQIRVREIRRCFVHVKPICVLYAAFLHKSDKLGSIYLFSGGFRFNFGRSHSLSLKNFSRVETWSLLGEHTESLL